MSFTLIATKSIPMVSCLFTSSAISNFVPTPSVAETSIGLLYPQSARLNNPPKPPIDPITPGLLVFLTSGLMSLTNLFPTSMFTPASLYVRFFEVVLFFVFGIVYIYPIFKIFNMTILDIYGFAIIMVKDD